MPEKDTIFSSNIKYSGVFGFQGFYQFCYEWLTEETGLDIMEDKYEEKIKGDKKEIIFIIKCFSWKYILPDKIVH